MKIIIGHLYYDLLNLYGDSGNIKALKYHLEEQGIDVEIRNISVGEKKDFKDIDLLYIGSGTNDNTLVALEDLKKDKKDLEKYIKDKKFILSTGNSIEIFGNYILLSKQKIKTLGVLDYVCMKEKRIVKDVNTTTNLIDDKIIGFENHDGKVLTFDDDIIKIDNFYGSYIIGPLLVRNPKFCSYFIKELITSKDKDFEFKTENYDLDIKAYNKATK